MNVSQWNMDNALQEMKYDKNKGHNKGIFLNEMEILHLVCSEL